MSNIVYIWTSLDWYIADKNWKLDWLNSVPNPDKSDFGFNDFQDKIDAIVMWRKTFDIVCSFDWDWPYKKPVFVLSNSLKEIPEKYSNEAVLIKWEPFEIVRTLKKHWFNNLYIDWWSTIQSFLKEDLIDELIITTLPILLWGWTSLFWDLEKPLNFKLKSSEVLVGEMVKSSYIRKK